MSPKVTKTKTSVLWRFFTQIDENCANCNVCKQKLSYKTSTSNLKKHLQNKHPTVKIPKCLKTCERPRNAQVAHTGIESENVDTSSEPAPSPSTSSCQPQPSTYQQTTSNTFLCKKNTSKSKDKIDEKLLQLFIQDFQPFSIVEDRGFQEFVSILNPAYQLPNKRLISKTLIPAIYEECRIKTKSLIDTGKTFCITTDSWISINSVSYNAITAHFLDTNFKRISLLLECFASDMHHTPENLVSELERVTTEWGIKNKIILAVSDNSSIIVNAIQIASWTHMKCVARTINLVVEDGLKNDSIVTITNKVKEIVRHFRKSNIANKKLLKFQENMGTTSPLELILEVPTRWNSTFYMLQRFIVLEEAIKRTVAIIEKDLPILAVGEWRIINELCQILKPFEDFTRTISEEKYCTASIVIPICNGVKKILVKLSKTQFSEPVNNVVRVLQSKFVERLGFVENNNTLSVSTFLDPKFKQMGFSNDITANTVKLKIINMIAEKIAIKSKEHQMQARLETSKVETKIENISDGEDIDEEDISIWSDFDKNVAASQLKGTSTSRAIMEMQRYMEEDIIPRHSESFLWWREHKQMLPHLSEIAQERLCAVASSVPCERLFSKAGQLLTERRKDKTR